MTDIEKTLKILFKKYKAVRTTLNKMRKPKKSLMESARRRSQISRPRKSKTKRDFLWRPDPYKILIACLLSLRTRDENTEKVVKKLFSVADTPEEIANMNLKKLEKLIFSSGHYKKKARILKHVSKDLIKRYKGKVPDTREQLLSIKGIGPKTANVVLAFAYNKKVIPVDVNVHRVSNRLGWVKTKTAEKTEPELHRIIPKKYWQEFNSVFIQFGKTICQPVSPWCSKCLINKHCPRIGVKRSR